MGTVCLDTSKAHRVRQHGDLMAIYTWVNDERALVLLPAYRKNAAWFIILEPAAYLYDNPEYLARQARKAAEVLNMEPSPNNWVKLATVIIEGLPDLIEMPSAPEPEFTKATYGEVKFMENGKLVGGEEIRFQKGGVEYGTAH